MKKKAILALALVLTMMFPLAACGDKGDANTGGSGEGDKGDKIYAIGTDTSFPPFEFQDPDSKEFVGIDLDILAAVAEDQGFEYELNSLGFDAAVQALASGQVDGVIAGMSITDKRKENSDFSDAYFESGVTMAVKAGNDQIKSFEDLKGQNVAVKANTMGRDFAESVKEQYGFTTSTFDDSPSMYQEVLTGNAAACFEDDPVMRFGIQQGNGLQLVGEKQTPNQYGFAVKKGENSELLKMFNEGLANIKENGTYDQILEKYGQDPELQK